MFSGPAKGKVTSDNLGPQYMLSAILVVPREGKIKAMAKLSQFQRSTKVHNRQGCGRKWDSYSDPICRS